MTLSSVECFHPRAHRRCCSISTCVISVIYRWPTSPHHHLSVTNLTRDDNNSGGVTSHARHVYCLLTVSNGRAGKPIPGKRGPRTQVIPPLSAARLYLFSGLTLTSVATKAGAQRSPCCVPIKSYSVHVNKFTPEKLVPAKAAIKVKRFSFEIRLQNMKTLHLPFKL